MLVQANLFDLVSVPQDPIRLVQMVNQIERLTNDTQRVPNPIRLVQMVNQIAWLSQSARLAGESSSPT
jgi:hypothetical protein